MNILAQEMSDSNRILTIALFMVMVLVTIGITIRGGRSTKTATDFHSGGRGFSAWQNGFAVAGDYVSAASFLGIAGTIALYGYDGFLYSIGFLVAWIVALLLVAESLRNSGRFTVADALSYRMRQRPVRTAASIATLSISIFYLLAQMVGTGALVTLLLGIKEGETFLGMDAGSAKVAGIVVTGLLMVAYVAFGGMKGTTWVQIFQACVKIGLAFVLAILVLAEYNFNLSALLGDAAQASGQGAAFLEPGLKYGTEVAGDSVQTLWNKLDLISLGLALVLGTAGLPHVLIRFYTTPDGKTARKSVNWAIGLIGMFYLLTLVLGFGAAAMVGKEAIVAENPAGNSAAPQLSQVIGENIAGSTGGAIMLALIASAAFAAILSVVAGLIIACSSSLAHDLYNGVFKRGEASGRQEVVFAKFAAVGVGAIAVVIAVFAQDLNVAFLVALAFAVAASANLPTLLFSLFWKRFNTAGAVAGIYGGLISSIGLVIFSPTFSSTPTSLLGEGVDIAWFPLSNPGLVSIPFGLICAVVGTLMSKETNPTRFASMQVRALTGAGAERAGTH
ncbi:MULTISPECIES: solute symporter family protein [Glycomyces]|uniref:Cation acetate symporter n=2 Tax=Glycomyces TaxID=58113 RepID=A0A9X3PK27_9ACTN|nr:cation acetate symporter [Glycomyces lechevalierae]MDA1385241.1 cation acetate symporter [Glycomyces lechevalierae]MDR7337143.1 cation/acetate symporter [Glycomyces lechevalierae]